MTPEWKALGRAVRARRYELGLTQADVTERGGPSRETIRHLELGERDNYRPVTFAQVDTALDWRPGTARSIVEGRADLSDPGAWKLSREPQRPARTWAEGRQADPKADEIDRLCDGADSMLGSEGHFVASEKLLEQSKESDIDSRERDQLVAQAQVHALLALFR